MTEALQVDSKEQSVLITGATGFLGKYAVDEFVQNGYEVIATGRNMAALSQLERTGATTIPASLVDLREVEVSADTIVHSAALSSPWGKWSEFYDSNVAGTRHMIDFAARNQIKRFVYVSSPSIYSGREDRFNIGEDDFDPDNNLNHYIRSKIMAEHMLELALQRGDIPELAIIRPRGLIGVGDPSLIPRLIAASRKTGIPLFNDGENQVDLTCVENVALALRLAAEAPLDKYHTFNITNGEPAAFKDLVDSFFAAIGEVPRYKKLNYTAIYGLAAILEKAFMVLPHSPEPPVTRYTVSTLAHSQTLDISRARQILGYTPTVSIQEGIAVYAENHRIQHA